ncbi:sugar ABC transporter periplasmic sugar-binding protein [Brucella abortus bv. 5 str. B3196]|nr:sugar ABC transporter periplasmic sugar-binding protein [Brucella abortus bv. 5 str. B3196]
MYYNADLLKAAGGDPDNPPTTWDEVIELGGKIKALGNGNEGIDFRWQGDDWMFSALLFGAGGTILTEDPAKQDAAWKFAKFAAGPYGASVVVPGTGYVPNNELAAKSDEYLGKFYEENPLFKAGLSQMSLMIPWYAFPGSNGVKVTQTIVDNLSRVVEQSATPEDALADAAKEVQRLLPRR